MNRRSFDQLEEGIVNHCPGVSAKEVFEKHNDNVYAAFLHKDTFPSGSTVSSTMMFDWRMAPLIVIAKGSETVGPGRVELREHWEIVLFDYGINVGHHDYVGGRQVWFKAAGCVLPKGAKFQPNVRYELKVSVERNRAGRKSMKVVCGDASLTYDPTALIDTDKQNINQKG